MILSLAVTFASSLAIAISGAVMPGPVFTAVVSESGRRGAVAGPLFMTGHSILELALVIAVCLGLSPLLALKQVFIITALAGGAIMLYMAIRMAISIPGLSLDLRAADKRHGHAIFTSIVLSLSNPYWTIWWITIGLGWLQKSMAYGVPGIAAFYFGHIAGDFLWYSLLSFGVSKGRKFMNDIAYRILIGACAALLASFAAWFLWSGGKELLALTGIT